MSERRHSLGTLKREHPFFFWGTVTVMLLLLGSTALVASRVPQYRAETAHFDRQMDQEERATRDRLLDSQTRRSEMALALMQREMRLKAAEARGVHLAISTDDSTLSLRHGSATLREVPVAIGGDSIVQAPDGRTWRFVRALGERHIREKVVGATYTIPDWVYISRGEPVPSEEQRTLRAGLGQYRIRLDDGTEIYSRPGNGPFSEGVKPAAFMVDRDADLRAIFDAIRVDTPVYIY
jgi:hypothetical protein